uniref:Uncharacterized protein n=1 Tax=viral metagenome TaxID=1070528 RepID=A0A6M3LBE1_9ZZZZ
MFDMALYISRPKRVWDGEGSREVLDRSTQGVLYCDPVLNDNLPMLAFYADADVRVGDIIQAPYNTFNDWEP